MEASGDGSEERGRDPAAEPVAPGVQLDQAELEVEARGTGEQLRMVEDEVLEPPYGEPELVEPNPADVSPGPAEGARPEADEGEPRGEETLASLRHPEAVSVAPVEESPESWGPSDSRQSEESSRLQQLTSVLETLVQGQQALNNRLERVEEVRSSHSWSSAESSQGLGWVDQTALDRWYTEATARAAASGHRDANMYIAGDVQSFPRPGELVNPWLRPPGWWTSRPEVGVGGLGGCGGPSPPPGFGEQPTPWTFPHPPPFPPLSSPLCPPLTGQAPWPLNPHDGPDRSLQQRFEAQMLSEASATPLPDRSLHVGPEAQALPDRTCSSGPEAQALQDRTMQPRSEAQALACGTAGLSTGFADRAAQQRSEAQALQDRGTAEVRHRRCTAEV